MLRLAATSPGKANEPRKHQRKSSHGFRGVRGGRGRSRDKFQGCLPGKEKTTELCNTPEEASAALRLLKQKRLNTPQPALPDFQQLSLPQQPSACDSSGQRWTSCASTFVQLRPRCPRWALAAQCGRYL